MASSHPSAPQMVLTMVTTIMSSRLLGPIDPRIVDGREMFDERTRTVHVNASDLVESLWNHKTTSRFNHLNFLECDALPKPRTPVGTSGPRARM